MGGGGLAGDLGGSVVNVNVKSPSGQDVVIRPEQSRLSWVSLQLRRLPLKKEKKKTYDTDDDKPLNNCVLFLTDVWKNKNQNSLHYCFCFFFFFMNSVRMYVM